MSTKTVLWWGRSDVEYSRNRIVRKLFTDLGWKIIDFSPRFSAFANIEACFKSFSEVSLVWVPCFRQRDIATAKRWTDSKKVPLIVDPLISAYDKQVWERKKFPEHSRKAKRLLQWEQGLLQSADWVIADTEQHAYFYQKTMGVESAKLAVLPVGAEESLFYPQKSAKQKSEPFRVLFFGSYIGLQGPEVIAEAVKTYDGSPVHWTFIGDGPLRANVEESLSDYNNVEFLDWVPYETLSTYIAKADLCLGIFGATEKTRRVIPNKVYQALACGRPVLTCTSNAYPASLLDSPQLGIHFVTANDASALAEKVTALAASSVSSLDDANLDAFKQYQQYFSEAILKKKLEALLAKLALS